MTGEINCKTPQERDQQERRSSVDKLTYFKPSEYISSPLKEAEPPNRPKTNMAQRSPVADVIEFEPLEDPPWRGNLGKDTGEQPREYPTVKQMIADIVSFQKRSTTKEDGEEVLRKIREKMIHKYIYQVNAEEEHGVGTLEKTIECIKAEEELKTSQLEEEERAPLTEEEQETTNVYRAYKWLEDKVEKECEQDKSLYGLIESSIVKELHKIIMDKLPLQQGQTKPGNCSEQIRYTTFNGEYYRYQRPNDMEEELNKVLDRFNSLIDWSKSISDSEEKILKVFQAASWFLFEFLDLHPFSDGNGRLCRLLCSYAMSVCSPFPTPIYNIWSESSKKYYINALVDTRNSSDRHPKALTTMIIECSWYGWKEYLKELEKIQKGIKNI